MEADQIENLHPSISNEPQTKKKERNTQQLLRNLRVPPKCQPLLIKEGQKKGINKTMMGFITSLLRPAISWGFSWLPGGVPGTLRFPSKLHPNSVNL